MAAAATENARPLKVLFVCMGNCCRSQMAEGLARQIAPDWQVHSAGLLPAGFVSSHAISVMREVKIDIAAQVSKGLDEVDVDGMNVVIAMGGFPTTDFVSRPEGKVTRDWAIPDPIGHGPELYKMVREQLRTKIEELKAQLAEKQR